MLKLKELGKNSINILKMKNGQLAVITAWESDSYISRIVMRYGNDLITVGCDGGNAWPGIFNDLEATEYKNCFVKILTPGTELIIK